MRLDNYLLINMQQSMYNCEREIKAFWHGTKLPIVLVLCKLEYRGIFMDFSVQCPDVKSA